ncbi:MAG: ABC transporter ATP-binding protein [Clostridium sp.]
MESYIEFNEVEKIYKTGEVETKALDGVNFSINKGEFVVIVGASGAGKSTVLNILGGMETITNGRVIVDRQDISTYNQKQLTEYRRFDIGFVFQFYNLVNNLTSIENIELATQISKNPLEPIKVLESIGLKNKKDNFPSQLSGGEQQRVSIARALAKNPKLLLCDEPTGALDYNTGKAVLKLLQETNKSKEMTILVITHNMALAPMGDKVITVRNGKVHSIVKNDNPVPIERIEW